VIQWLVFEFSLICVAFVGIFDTVWPNPTVSMQMHVFGAVYSFLGNTISAVILFFAVFIIYYVAPKDQRKMYHPGFFGIVIVELVGMYFIFRSYPNPLTQWLIMLSLLTFVFANSRLFPEKLPMSRIPPEQTA
jgi:uncharacterized BrkB/YihY/UPF0761 family membrane protein